ncbi:hypothetical protein BS78_03G249800 [Paspalum vaginatum]|nr:hypothetical protein BS78_03G249800 [Paspalum vaginatum]
MPPVRAPALAHPPTQARPPAPRCAPIPSPFCANKPSHAKPHHHSTRSPPHALSRSPLRAGVPSHDVPPLRAPTVAGRDGLDGATGGRVAAEAAAGGDGAGVCRAPVSEGLHRRLPQRRSSSRCSGWEGWGARVATARRWLASDEGAWAGPGVEQSGVVGWDGGKVTAGQKRSEDVGGRRQSGFEC